MISVLNLALKLPPAATPGTTFLLQAGEANKRKLQSRTLLRGKGNKRTASYICICSTFTVVVFNCALLHKKKKQTNKTKKGNILLLHR